MQVTEFIAIILNLINFSQCKMQPYVVDGHDANIKDVPYAVRLKISCVESNKDKSVYTCGASVVNQKLTLTAAHCLAGCISETNISIFVGRELKGGEATATAHSYFSHDEYNELTLVNDISLIRLKTSLTFSEKVNRVALMADPPYGETAVVAGWGLWDEANHTFPKLLQYTEQHVEDKKSCEELYGNKHIIRDGTFCAGNKDGYAAKGDSGSALVVRHYIQIGLVSYKFLNAPLNSRHITIYTDTGYFYDWITKSAEHIICGDSNSSK